MRILYIAGAGRSGSTMLEIILGNAEECFSVGEVRYFWEYWLDKSRLCGCGHLLTDCPFWTAVVRRLNGENININEVGQLSSKYDRTRKFPRYMMPINAFGQMPDVLLEATQKLYEAIWLESGQKLIIDSSKVPSHLYILSQSSSVDVRTLHLVRDGRAVAYSWNKRQKKELGLNHSDGYMPHHSMSRALITWVMENLFVTSLKNRVEVYAVVRYEDLVKDIPSVLKKSFQTLELPFNGLVSLQSNSFLVKPTHSIGGNPLRFKNRPLQINIDEEWRQKMPARQQLSLGLLGLPLMKRYRYSLW